MSFKKSIKLVACRTGQEYNMREKIFIREKKWSQSIAVGSKGFVEDIKEKLGIRAKGLRLWDRGVHIIFVKRRLLI